MTYEILIGALGFIAAIAVVIKPLITPNNNITALTISLDQLRKILDELKGRVDGHGHEIDTMRDRITDHEARIKQLEKQ